MPGLLPAQKFIEPDKQKQFNITVNYEDYTVKTQMLSQPKDIVVKNDKTYMWYSSQKILDTKGGYDGKLIHGKYNAFYLNNQLKEQGSVKYGLKNKEWKYWYPDGKLKEVINWKSGLKNGHYELYNDYGKIMARGNFRKDLLHGKFYTYGVNGIITEKKKYKNGEEIIPKTKKVAIGKTQKEKTKADIPNTKNSKRTRLFKKRKREISSVKKENSSRGDQP